MLLIIIDLLFNYNSIKFLTEYRDRNRNMILKLLYTVIFLENTLGI
jgi:hypothetical protein